MTSQRRYRVVNAEVRKDAVGRVLKLCSGGMSRSKAARAVADDIGVHPNSVMNWVTDAAGPVTGSAAADLHRQIAELQQQLTDSRSYNRTLVERLHETDPGLEASG
ncbi:transposase (plasmid) [Nocardia sp. NBC_01503]|uniref:transposase n=1 Tax=Nocardia sp. NBC_01503 TaxID=2975997 RepID=UPI002E7AAF44|nr:transposase [Nocardia sp. NBC_01503]WTL36624.1 transposase [Nocardia sp. NBC_01503]